VQGWYVAFDPKTKKELSKKTRAEDTNSQAFWKTIYDKTDFKRYVENRFSVGHKAMLQSISEPSIEEED
jgi:hypothetical protein